jgi:hypothetical protein
VLACTKNNLAMPPRSLMFILEEAEGGAVRINWLGDTDVSAKDLLGTTQDQEHADARSEAVEFLSDVLANGPVPATDILQDAEDAGIAEKTLRRAKKVLGVVAYREGEAGKRGAGRWLWKQPIADLVTRVNKDGQSEVQDGHGTQEKTGGRLYLQEDTVARESGLPKRNIQDVQHNSLDGQYGQDGQLLKTGHLERCIHDFLGGKGCYMCDPNHPLRKKGGTT